MALTGGASSSELERRERQWLAEKATLEEYYEVSARNQRDAEHQVGEVHSERKRNVYICLVTQIHV